MHRPDTVSNQPNVDILVNPRTESVSHVQDISTPFAVQGRGMAVPLALAVHPIRSLTASVPLSALFQPVFDLLDLGRVQPEGSADLPIGPPGHQHFAGGLRFGLREGQDARPLATVQRLA